MPYWYAYLPTVQGFPVQYRDFSDLAVLYRELLHLYKDLSFEKINDWSQILSKMSILSKFSILLH